LSSHPAWESQYRAARRGCGFYPVPGRVLTALNGAERNSFLHGMVVSDVHKAPEYSWTISALLNPRGKMTSDLALYHLPDAIWIETEQGLRETVETTLRRYALRAVIGFENLSDSWSIFDIIGPEAGGLPDSVPEPGQVATLLLEGETTCLARTDLPLGPALRWLVPAGLAEAATDRMVALGATTLVPEAARAFRMEAGIPVFGSDIGTDNLVMEVPYYKQGISYEKGCYIGQETVARLHSRGENLARHLRGILTASAAEPRTKLSSEDREVGTVTSTTWSPTAGKHLSLAMVHRSVMESGTVVQVGPQCGTVMELPLQEG